MRERRPPRVRSYSVSLLFFVVVGDATTERGGGGGEGGGGRGGRAEGPREREARERLLLGGVVAGYVCCVRPRGCINHFPDLRGEYIPRFIPDIRAGTFALNRII